MKVGLVHRYYPQLGGVTTVVNCLKEGLRKKDKVEVITQQQCKNHFVKTLKGRFFYFKLFKYLREGKFDIIHTHSAPVCFFSPFIKIKIILTIHGFESIFEKMSFWKMIYVKLISFTKILSYHFADELIAVSNLVKEDVSKKYKIKKEKIKVINNMVDLKRFFLQKIRRKDKNLRFFSYELGKRKEFQ